MALTRASHRVGRADNFGGGRHDPKVTRPTRKQILAAWKHAPLQRCHVVPAALGGADEPANLFLMCRECHDRAPNTASREYFLRWATSQSWGRLFNSVVEEELRTFGATDDEIVRMTTALRSQACEQWALKRMSMHFSQAGYGPRLTASSFVATLLEYIRSIDIAPDAGA